MTHDPDPPWPSDPQWLPKHCDSHPWEIGERERGTSKRGQRQEGWREEGIERTRVCRQNRVLCRKFFGGFGLALRDCFASATVSLSVREKVCLALNQFLHNPKNTFSSSSGISLSLNFLRYYNIEFVCTYVYITIDICCFYFLGLVIMGIWSLRMEWNWVPLTRDYSHWRCC